MKQRRFRPFLPAILWFLASIFLLTLPGSSLPKVGWLDRFQLDKIVHIGIFSLLTLLLYLPYQSFWRTKNFLAPALYWALSALAYGVIMEFVQKNWIPHRSFDVGDIVANGIGSFLPLLFIRLGWLKPFRKSALIRQ